MRPTDRIAKVINTLRSDAHHVPVNVSEATHIESLQNSMRGAAADLQTVLADLEPPEAELHAEAAGAIRGGRCRKCGSAILGTADVAQCLQCRTEAAKKKPGRCSRCGASLRLHPPKGTCPNPHCDKYVRWSEA